MKKTRRTSKVGAMVRDALVEVLRHDLKAAPLGLVSITDVDVSPDLHFARVYVSGYDEKETQQKVDELQAAKGRIRGFLGKRIHLRYTPELDFKYDETTMRASRIEALLVKHAPKPEPETESESPIESEDEHDHDTDS